MTQDVFPDPGAPQDELDAPADATGATSPACTPGWVAGVSYWQDYLTVIELNAERPGQSRNVS